MKRFWSRHVWLLSVALLLLSESRAATTKPIDPTQQPDIAYRYPVITAPKLAKAPTIDGTIDKAEWSGAAQSSPLVLWRNEPFGAISENYACYWTAYTDDTLYLAWRIDRSSYALKPKAEATQNDSGTLWSDDKVEIMIRPGVGTEGQGYNLVVNAKGVHADRLNGRIDWSEPWTVSARVTERGWEGELALPFKSLGRVAPKPGETWELLFLSSPTTPGNIILLNSFIHEWPGHAEYGYLRFGGDNAPAVRVLEAGPIDAHEAGMTLEVVGRQAVPVKIEAALLAGKEGSKGIQAEVNVRDPGNEVLVPRKVDLNFFDAVEQITAPTTIGALQSVQKIEEMQTLQPDLPRRFVVHGQVPYGSHVLVYRVRNADTGEVLAGGAAPFVQKPPFEVFVERFLLVKKGLKITAEYRRMPDATDKHRVVAELLDSNGKKLGEVSEPVSKAKGRSEMLLPLKNRFDVAYRVRTQILDPSGKSIVKDEHEVQLPTQPEWLDNTIGKDDVVLPGWEPLRIKGDAAQVTLRTYKLGPSGLPAEVTSRGKALLTGPVELTLGDQKLKWQRKLESASDTKAVWTATANDLKLKTTLEYDGALIYELTLPPGTLSNLVVNIPYRRDLARTRNGKVMKPEDKPVAVKTFEPEWSVGEFETGFHWYCEWDRYWQIGKLPVCEMTENGKTLDWKVRLIGAEGRTLKQPETITFVLQAEPVREVDVSYQYVNRHLYGGSGVRISPGVGMTVQDLVECSMRYPLTGNATADKGAVAMRINASTVVGLFAFGEGTNVVSVWRKSLTLAVCQGTEDAVWNVWKPDVNAKMVNRDLKPIIALEKITYPENWMPIGLSWSREGEQARLVFSTINSLGKVLEIEGRLPFATWQAAFNTGTLRIGGQGMVVVDQLVICPESQAAAVLLAALKQKPDELKARFSVADSMNRLRFYRGLQITEPELIRAGKGGVAGAKYMGTLVELVAGSTPGDKAVLLPSQEKADDKDLARSLHVGILMPAFEQFNNINGYYGQNYSENTWFERLYMKNYVQKGFGTMLYVGFGLEPDHDPRVAAFSDELSLKPKGMVYTAIYPNYATPYQDYLIWELKESIDKYGVQALHLDGTVSHRAPMFDPFLGFGYYDEQGKEHTQWPIFAARELSRRMRWLMHVYRKDGHINLGHGARKSPFICGFMDVVMSGEGGFFYSADAWDKMAQPEDYNDCDQFRQGIPHQTLTKGGSEHKFSPNLTFMYMLMSKGSLRMSDMHVSPTCWYVDTNAPNFYTIAGNYDPYFAKNGVPEVAAPMTLWWMLSDDFDCQHAEFAPFFHSGEYVKLNPDRLRSALYWHKGKGALIIVANFTAQDATAEVKLDLKKLGLTGKKLVARDGFLDDDYPMAGDTVKLTIPVRSYRIIRVEER